MAGNIYNFNAAVAAAVQDGILDLKFLQGLDSQLAFSNFTYKEPLNVSLGDKKTFTKNTRLAVDTTPRAASDGDSNLDNGMTATKAGIEQYTIQLSKWNKMDKVNLLQDYAMIDRDLQRSAGNLGMNLAQLKERLVRKAYLDSYLGGSTRVITGGTTNATNAHVDDIRGFQYVLNAGGALVAVSGTDTLEAYEYDSTGALVRTLTITGAVADVSNVSSLKDNGLGGISGQLTFTASPSAAPAADNAIVAKTAPKVLRSGAKVHSGLLSAGDVANFGLIQDGVAYLRNQGNTGAQNGNIYCIAGHSTIRQLQDDPKFLNAFNTRAESAEIKGGKIFEFGGVTFVPTTEVPISNGASGSKVHRMLLVADMEACMEADWEGFDQFIADKQQGGLHYASKVMSNAAMIIPAPIDAQGEQQKLTYMLVTGFCCGSDLKTDHIPTASLAMFKKALWIEHVA